MVKLLLHASSKAGLREGASIGEAMLISQMLTLVKVNPSVFIHAKIRKKGFVYRYNAL